MHSLDVKKTLPWILFLIFFAVLNETVFNVSIPAIAHQYSLSPTGVSWMMTTFIIFFGVGSVIFGRLSDLFSLKRLIVWGILIYAAGSFLGFLLQFSYPLVIAARALQGMGGSAIPALVMVIVARYFAPEVRGRLFGSIGSIIAVALGVGPVLGGFVAGSLHWSWLFLIPMIILVAIPFLTKILPDETTRPGHIDLTGAALMTLGIGSLIVYLTYPEWPWLVAGLVLLAAFTLRILTAKEPFVDPELFTNRPFSAAVVTSLFLFGVVIGIFFILPLMLNKVYGLDTNTIGLVLFPGAISGVFFGPVGGQLADKKGNRFVLSIGLVLVVASLIGTAFLMAWSPWYLAGVFLFTYVGFSFLQTGLINSVSQTLPEEETGVGMGVFNLVGILAGAVGTALVAKILEANLLGFAGILLVFAVAAGLAGTWYASTLKRPGRTPASSPSLQEDKTSEAELS
jgi:MFS transporter, DHA2 family, metal-tetracycline-proton antiporter